MSKDGDIVERILLIEDDESILFALDHALSKEGYLVEQAITYTQAINHMQHPYDLIILDVNLPDGNGFDLCQTIRKDSQTPIIFLSAADTPEDIVHGLKLEADDYVTKPFQLNQLLLRIKNILRRTSALTKTILSVQHLTMDVSAAQVYIHKQPIELSALEFRLLDYLIRHRGQMLTRNQLLEHIWDLAGNFVNDNTLSVYIKRLREKIELDPSNPTILLTVRGMGYKIP